MDTLKEAWMAQSQRSRLLKTGGIIAFIVFLLFLFSPSKRTGFPDIVGSMQQSAWRTELEHEETNANV